MKSFNSFLQELDSNKQMETKHLDETIDYFLKHNLIDENIKIEEGADRFNKIVKTIGLGLQQKLLGVSNKLKSTTSPVEKLNLLSTQMNLVGALSMLSVAASGDTTSLLSKIKVLSALRS